MSVDTTVLILKCIDGYRVATVGAAENITEFQDKAIVQEIFGKAKVFTTLGDAQIEADRQNKEHLEMMGYPSEYGIHVFDWPNPIQTKAHV